MAQSPSYHNDINEWVSALEAQHCRPKQKGDKWRAYCPAHDGNSPSLSLTERNGKVLVNCFGPDCSYDDIREALGFTGKPKAPARERPPEPPPKPQPLPTGPQYTTYMYEDEQGTPVMAVVRVELGAGRKRFIQFTPTPDPNLWIPRGMDSKQPLFHLPKLRAKGRVALVEGEKCVLACEGAWPDQLVTCWAGGAKAWRRTDYEPLRGRELSMLSDGDDDGRTAMRQLADHLVTDLDCTVKLALVPGDSGEDVSDWIQADGPDAAAAKIAELLEDYEPDPDDHVEPEAQDETAKSAGLSERMLAQTFIQDSEWSGKYAYDEEADTWQEWNGGYWEDAGLRLTLDVGQHIARTISRFPKVQPSTWLKNSVHNGVVALSRAFAVEEFDPYPHLLGLPWLEVLDCQTGEQKELLKEHRITKTLSDRITRPKGDRTTPTQWEPFVWESLSAYDEDDREQIARFLQEWAGTALAGDCRDELFPFLYGQPGTGKGTFAETLLAIFGGYGATVSGSRVTGQFQQHLQWLAGLKGKRFVLIPELPPGGKWDTESLQKLVSGEMIEANLMRSNSIQFRSQAHVLATGNHRPTARASAGIWRRLRMIQFQYKPPRPNKQLKQQFLGELDVVYLWAQQGLNRWLANGQSIKTPGVLDKDTEEYKTAADSTLQFIEERLVIDPEAYTAIDSLYRVFTDWWKQGNEGKAPPSKKALGHDLEDLGYKSDRQRVPSGIGEGKRVRWGLRIREDALYGRDES